MSQSDNTSISPASSNGVGGFWSNFYANLETTGIPAKKSIFGFILAWCAFFGILFLMPLPEGLSQAGKSTLAVVVWACVIWVSEAIPIGMTGVAIPMLLVLSGAVEKFPMAVRGFTSNAYFICMAAFIMAAIVQVANIDRRIAITLLHKLRIKTANSTILGLFGVNFILSIIVPGANPRGALLLPIIKGITDLFGGSKSEDNAKKHIMIQVLVYGSMISGMCILTSHLPNLVLVDLFHKELSIDISYFEWFIMQWPYLGMFFITNWWLRWHFKTKNVSIKGGEQVLTEQYKKLPRISQSEVLILLVFGFTALLWMTQPYHKIPAHVAAMLGITLLFIPGLHPFKWKQIQDRTIWGTLIMLGGALSMSSTMGSSGLAQWLAGHLHGLADGHAWWIVLIMIMGGTHIIRLGMLSNVAAVSLFAPILLQLATHLNLHPVIFTMLVADTDTFAFILPTQITVAVIAYGSHTFSMTDYAKAGWVSVLLAITYAICVMVPWYAFLGLPLWDPTAPWPF